jgi:lysine-specific demethylase/histidyl-hydroxylase NO66
VSPAGAAPAPARPALARCSSASADVFAREHWSRAPLLSRAAELPSGFTDLLSDADVDELVAARGLREPFFRMVEGGSGVRGTTRTINAGGRRLLDAADSDKVRDAHLSGATLVLNALHRTHPPVVRFCQALAADLGHATQCNAYVTPGGGAQGFAYHHDTHDVFVLQVSGRKHWRAFAPVLELPLPSQSRAGDDLVGPDDVPLLDVVLEPGDALYLPRGYVHAASTTDDPSVHLTVGVLATTWYDVLQDTLALAADDPGFRDALPMAGGQADPAAFLSHAAAWLAGLSTEDVAALVAQRAARAAPVEPLGMLAQAATLRALDVSSVVRPRANLPWTLSSAGERLALTLPDRVVELPLVAEAPLRRLLAGPVRVGDLEGLDLEGSLVLVRRMLREGVVTGA